MKEHKKTIKAL